MAGSELKECPCSNITIMQLFHELKQRYPKIPDHIVSKVIRENSHDKTACEIILERESHYYLQSYPGALISGNVRDQTESLCTQCSVPKLIQHQRSENEEISPSWQSVAPKKQVDETNDNRESYNVCNENTIDNTDCANEVDLCPNKCSDQLSHSECTKNNLPVLSVMDCTKNGCSYHGKVSGCESGREGTKAKKKEPLKNDAITRGGKCELGNGERNSYRMLNSSSSSLGTCIESFTEEEEETKDRFDASSESSAVIMDRTSESGCDSESKEENLLRSQTYVESSSPKGVREREIETYRWNVEDGGRKSAVISGIISHSSSESPPTHNYQVAVECSMHHIPLDRRINRDNTRSFTSVNLCLRPPSSEPQPPIEIQSGQSLTYTTSSFNPRKGYQSQLQIRIDPGGGSSTFSACRTFISTPQFTFSSSKTTNCTYHFPASHRCQNRHHLRELLEKQKERKDLLARELQREKDKLRCMQNDVRLMKAAIAQRPNPHVLPKLKADILRLRTECERLTAAVDMYSDNQSNLPLGETNEEFYRNIYTGQRFQREGWSCHICTFRNHSLLSVCEECEMPRLPLGTAVEDVRSPFSNVFSNNNNTSFCTGAGTSTSASLITAPLQER